MFGSYRLIGYYEECVEKKIVVNLKFCIEENNFLNLRENDCYLSK